MNEVASLGNREKFDIVDASMRDPLAQIDSPRRSQTSSRASTPRASSMIAEKEMLSEDKESLEKDKKLLAVEVDELREKKREHEGVMHANVSGCESDIDRSGSSVQAEIEAITEAAEPVAQCKLLVEEKDDKDLLFESLPRETSRNDLKGDSWRLKSATLDRVGRMFKSRPPTGSEKFAANADIPGTRAKANPDSTFGEQPSRKEKTNSLGRMFKLVDKDGTPRKLFTHPRAGSLSRLFRKHSSNITNNNGAVDKTVEEASRGIFSRMFNQLRGRSTSRNSSRTESKVSMTQDKGGKSCLPPKLPMPMKATSSNLPKSPTTSTVVEYKA